MTYGGSRVSTGAPTTGGHHDGQLERIGRDGTFKLLSLVVVWWWLWPAGCQRVVVFRVVSVCSPLL